MVDELNRPDNYQVEACGLAPAEPKTTAPELSLTDLGIPDDQQATDYHQWPDETIALQRSRVEIAINGLVAIIDGQLAQASLDQTQIDLLQQAKHSYQTPAAQAIPALAPPKSGMDYSTPISRYKRPWTAQEKLLRQTNIDRFQDLLGRFGVRHFLVGMTEKDIFQQLTDHLKTDNLN